MMAKIMVCLAYAHQTESMEPGTFQTTMDEMLTLNDLPKVKFPEKIPKMKFATEKVKIPKGSEEIGQSSTKPKLPYKPDYLTHKRVMSETGASCATDSETETEQSDQSSTSSKRPRNRHSPHNKKRVQKN